MESTGTTTDRIFRTAPAAAFPPSAPPVVYVEVDNEPRWIIREDAPLAEVVAELDTLATHLVRHGLWLPASDDDRKPPSPPLRNVS